MPRNSSQTPTLPPPPSLLEQPFREISFQCYSNEGPTSKRKSALRLATPGRNAYRSFFDPFFGFNGFFFSFFFLLYVSFFSSLVEKSWKISSVSSRPELKRLRWTALNDSSTFVRFVRTRVNTRGTSGRETKGEGIDARISTRSRILLPSLSLSLPLARASVSGIQRGGGGGGGGATVCVREVNYNN